MYEQRCKKYYHNDPKLGATRDPRDPVRDPQENVGDPCDPYLKNFFKRRNSFVPDHTDHPRFPVDHGPDHADHGHPGSVATAVLKCLRRMVLLLRSSRSTSVKSSAWRALLKIRRCRFGWKALLSCAVLLPPKTRLIAYHPRE